MLQRPLFVIGLKRQGFLKYYNFVRKNEFESLKKLREYQYEKLKKIINYSIKNIPYYNRIFKRLNLSQEDISSVEDLQKLPILNKEIIRKNQKDFIPLNLKKQKYLNVTTGGSTGDPLRYRLSKEDAILGNAMQYANWGYAGYKLGDKMATIAGSSLVPSLQSNFKNKIREFMTKNKSYSSFNLNNKYMRQILIDLNRFKPKYLRGYASSIYLFANFIKSNDFDINFQPNGIFTTSEVLHKFQRGVIEKVFNCKVFDQYGLHDGGISAYECEIHNGFHVDMLRSIMEIVDKNGKQLETGKEGKILATSLHNYAMPFLRYDTGDLGVISDEKCKCGRELLLLKKIIGRTTDYLEFSNGNKIGTPILTVLFGKFDIIQYQLIEKKSDKLIINIIKGETYSKDDEDKIRDIFYSHIGKIDIEFKYVDRIKTNKAGKWKFIIRENN